jgi:soluble lytic murein transglycosylase-like protein
MTKWIRPVIEEIAKAHGLDPVLVEAVVRTESSGNPRAWRFEPAFWDRYLKNKPFYQAIGPKRAASSYGLMQLMFSTAREEFGFQGEPEDLFNPRTSLTYGCRLLKKNIVWADGNEDAALAAYNGGRTRDNLKAPYRNAGYVVKVRGHYKDIKDGK